MRGTKAKQLRRFVKEDTPDLVDVVYTTRVTGQEYKPYANKILPPHQRLPINETTVLGECKRSYYKLLKRIWKHAS